MRRLLGGTIVLILAAAATGCGDDGSALTPGTETTLPPGTTTTTTAPPSTTVAPPTTETTAPGGDAAAPGTIGALRTAPVEDPLWGSGYHEMDWGDESGSILISNRSVTGAPGEDLFALNGFTDPVPAVGGLASDQVLVAVWLQFPTAPAPMTALVVYAPGQEGFEAVIVVDSDAIEQALLQTTDYAAAAPDGDPIVMLTPTEFDAAGETFVTGVRVDDTAGGTAYEGEIACDFAGPELTCETLSDDGVLRPGDEGEQVEALQEDLTTAGYYSGNLDGRYGPQTEAAVSRFQRDYLLGVDGKAGPNTLEMLAAVVDGTTDLVVASQDGVGPVPFGTAWASSRDALLSIFGAPDADSGWFTDGCSAADERRLTWDGFTAVFSDRNGTRQFDGWHVDDLSDLPGNLLMAGGIHGGTTWSYLDDVLGAAFYDDYLGQRWRITEMGYGNGRFVGPVSNPPAGGEPIASFGTGTGGYESC